MWKNRKAQSTVEYAVLIAVVAGALLAMQIYMKRGAMGKLRSSTDQIGDQLCTQGQAEVGGRSTINVLEGRADWVRFHWLTSR